MSKIAKTLDVERALKSYDISLLEAKKFLASKEGCKQKEYIKFAQEKYSNGETSMQYFEEYLQPDALYLLDEPEVSLSHANQVMLAAEINKMARLLECQFIIATLLGNCFYCDNLLIYIHKKQPGKAFMKGFRLVSALAIFLGAGMEMSLLWDLSDVLMGVMALINIPVILILSGIAVKAIQDYEVQLKQGINPVFKSADIGLSQKTDFWR